MPVLCIEACNFRKKKNNIHESLHDMVHFAKTISTVKLLKKFVVTILACLTENCLHLHKICAREYFIEMQGRVQCCKIVYIYYGVV